MCHGETLYCGRQAFILFSIMMQSIGNGIMLAFPSVLNSAVLNPDSEDLKITSAEASWLAATIGFTGLLGFFILSPIMQINGRKAVHIIKNVVTLIGWVLLYCAQSITSLYVARAVQGIAMGGIYLNVIIIGEYTHPCRRGYFTAIQKIALSLGALVCHTMSLWCNWRQIAASAIIWNVLATIFTCMWPESPFYLAMRGRYDQCEKSFRWLNGKRARSKELKDLISHQIESREQRKNEVSSRFNKFLMQLKRRDFRKSLLIVAILTVTMDLAGRNYFKAYVFQIMKELTGSTSTAVYISIGSDVSTLTALLISCITVQYFGRRYLLFTFGISTVVLLYTISVTLYLKTNGIVLVWPWLAPGLILFTNFIVHIGVSPICFAVMGEIFPLELKGLGCSINGIVYTSSYGTLLKITPVLMESIGLGLTYVIYGSCLFVCLLALYFIMPETKDEALLDIENDLKGIKKPVAASESLLKVS